MIESGHHALEVHGYTLHGTSAVQQQLKPELEKRRLGIGDYDLLIGDWGLGQNYKLFRLFGSSA